MSATKRNNAQLLGSTGNVLVLAHGFGCDQTMWNAQLPVLREKYRIVLLDHVGAGGSDVDAYSPRRYQTLRSYALDLIEVLRELAVTDVTLVGHSMSGMIGVLAQIEEPSLFKKLILIGASPRYLNDIDYVGGFDRQAIDGLYDAMRTNYYAWASGFAPIAMQNPDRPNLAQDFAATLRSMRPDVALSIARMIFESDHRADLKSVQVPTLVLQTHHDVAVPLAVGEYLAQHIPQAQLQVLDATGHFPPISAPEQVNRAILDFA